MTIARRIPDGKMDIAAFLAFVENQPDDTRCELIDGFPWAMVGTTLRHGTIVLNIASWLRPLARHQGCRVYVTDHFVRDSESDGTLVVPDVFLRCGPIDDLTRIVTDPSLVVEVLSPSNFYRDRGPKFAFYQSLASMQQIVLVYAEERRIESWERLPEPDIDGMSWASTVITETAASVAIRQLGLSMPLTAIYDDTSLLT